MDLFRASNNLAMTSVIDFEARAFGEFSGSAELTEDRAVVEPRREQAAKMDPG